MTAIAAQRRTPSAPPTTPRELRALFEKRLVSLSHRQPLWRVFADFCELAALSYANVVEQRPDREARYLEILRAYEPDEQRAFPELLGLVIAAHDAEFCDFLGESFMGLELSSHWRGQFFTPYSLCSAIARLTFDEGTDAIVAERGFVTVQEPASGAGALCIAAVETMLARGLNPQRQLHVTAVDVDATAAHMTFVQLCVYGIPAVVVIGNTLSMEFRETLRTPAHHLGFWNARLARQHPAGSTVDGLLVHAPEVAQGETLENQADPVRVDEPVAAAIRVRPAPDVNLGRQLALFGALRGAA